MTSWWLQSLPKRAWKGQGPARISEALTLVDSQDEALALCQGGELASFAGSRGHGLLDDDWEGMRQAEKRRKMLDMSVGVGGRVTHSATHHAFRSRAPCEHSLRACCWWW